MTGKRFKTWAALAVLAPSLLLLPGGCSTGVPRPPRGVKPIERVMEVTAYCNCGHCCGWHRSRWLRRPIVSAGAQAGQRKQVGITASGTRARMGTVAADTRRYPFGTIVYVPGYGYGRVEDRGGAIRGDKLDLWYPSHQQALEWGRQRVRVLIWPAEDN